MAATNIALAIWRVTNKFSAFCSLIGFSSIRRIKPSSRTNNRLLYLYQQRHGQTEHRIPPHRQCFNVSGNPMATVITVSSTHTLTVDNCKRFAKTKELQSQRTKADTQLQHICFCPDTRQHPNIRQALSPLHQ